MQLSILSRISQEDFNSSLNQYLAESPSTHYKVYKIPKRSFGFRVIAQPTPQLKNIQRKIVGEIKGYMHVHSAAKAYVKDCSIKDNAIVHVNSNYLLKLDLENFFNSLTPAMLARALKYQGLSLLESEVAALNELLFWNRTKKKSPNLVLSVGAPSSPFLSNVIMYEFDEAVSKFCSESGLSYSRYADDLTFSTSIKDILFEVPKFIESILFQLFQGKLKLNYSKTTFSSKAHNRHVTGVTLTNNNKLSLGRERKRYIRAMLHKFSCEELCDYDVQALKGLISFALNIEPTFVDKMKGRYGAKLFDDLFKYNNGDN
ncbi:RNA-directed DNA polymerase [Vibrio sp. 070316B]|uniref:retron St85 family RNA-directed DNA polymerase n=1 Tax=Vibrio sp. 070316B TaxID=2607608 RepID=UPI001493A102|nr:retron St85 family RNA-directed DNA polymerase [Vibrio sp. 070316B]NOI38693.1 RNA-directed DNA polymerase [Vibrio sp. 070316B]